MAKPKKTAEPKIIRPDDIDPHHNWKRPLQAPGHTQVDFEERINFRRLHDYRLARVRAALAASGLGALLSFDQHNIRYTTSTVIGEWARDKLTRYSLLTGTGDPYIWDFGSAAKHHRLYAPWLHVDHCKAGLLGMRGAVGSDITLFRDAAKEIKAIYIRYTTSTVIGEWARDKLTRYSLLTGTGDPYIWDFGSAAKHHRLYAPWLHVDHCKAGLLGMRGAVGSDITLFRDAAKEIKAI